MAEYILRDQAIIAVTGAKLPDVSASGLPIANGKRSVTDCVRRLKEIPAADVRPVVRGKWIFYDSFAWKCTHCGWLNYHNMGVPNVYNYCPNCGARMEES